MGVLAWAEVYGPVDEVEVLLCCEPLFRPPATIKTTYKILELELSKGVVECRLDRLWVVLSVPQLRGDENVLTLDAEVLEGALDTLSDLLLVLVAGWWKILSAQFFRLIEAIAPIATPPAHRGAPQPSITGSGCVVYGERMRVT